MLQFSAGITQKNPQAYDKLLKSAQKMTDKIVVAGFPKGKLNTPHYDNGESIIDVAIHNNFGIGVPRRDFMTPSSKKWEKFFKESLAKVQKDLLNDKIDIDKFLNAMGQRGSDIISKEIIDLDYPPNAPSTIKAKGGKSNPLVDSGDMSRATTWQIRRTKEK